jgi:hypothetical protein
MVREETLWLFAEKEKLELQKLKSLLPVKNAEKLPNSKILDQILFSSSSMITKIF